MLVKITTQCQMGCTHCMENAEPQGEHMSLDIFKKVQSFITKVYGGLNLIMLSGGEPTEHPEILKILEQIKGWRTILLSNGLFMSDKIAEDILKSGVMIQVYNDPRYYPKKILINHPRVLFFDKINMITPFGRARTNKIPTEKVSPSCFNLRSCVRYTRDFQKGLIILRTKKKLCTPSIDIYGNILAGESRECHKIGTVESSFTEIRDNLLTMKCNKCGLEDKLNSEQKEAIYNF